MASVLINRNDLSILIENYVKHNDTFRLLSSYQIKGNPNAYVYNFLLEGKNCTIHVFYKRKETKIIPIGKNAEQSNLLIDYIKKHSLNPNIEAKQIVFPSTPTLCEDMKNYFTMICPESIKVEIKANNYIFVGYNQDRINIHQYKDKIMIQGKPLFVFGLVINYIAENTDIDLKDFSDLMCKNFDINMPFVAVRERMENLLGKSYEYIDEAIRKTLSSSMVMLETHKNDFLEDYSGCVTGAFKTLEGYLKKILKKKFHHSFNRLATFEMFDTYTWTLKSGYFECTKQEERQLCALYKLFNNKRNTYLHAKINPSMTSVISSYMEAENIFTDIVTTIKTSYEVFFGD